MEGRLILNVVHIYGTRMIEVGIDSLSIENDMGGIMRGIEPLNFIPIHLGGFGKIKGYGRVDHILVGTRAENFDP